MHMPWALTRSNPALLLNSGLARTGVHSTSQLRAHVPQRKEGIVIFTKTSPIPVKREGLAEHE